MLDDLLLLLAISSTGASRGAGRVPLLLLVDSCCSSPWHFGAAQELHESLRVSCCYELLVTRSCCLLGNAFSQGLPTSETYVVRVSVVAILLGWDTYFVLEVYKPTYL